MPPSTCVVWLSESRRLVPQWVVDKPEVFIIGAIHITFQKIIERDQMPEQPLHPPPFLSPSIHLFVAQLMCLTITTSQPTQSMFVMRNQGRGLGKSNIPLSSPAQIPPFQRTEAHKRRGTVRQAGRRACRQSWRFLGLR